MQGQLLAFVVPANFELDRMISHSQTCQAAEHSFKIAAPKVVSLKTKFFRIAGTSEAENLVSGKAESNTMNHRHS